MIGTAISWDCDWQGQAAIGTDSWTAEFAIPFAELRFSKEMETATWGINFWRNDESPAEEQTWADLGERQYAVSEFGHLTDLPISGLVTKRPVKFKPYGTLKPQMLQPGDGETTTAVKADAGLDLRYPIKDFTVDLTLNPDFAQIEADPDLVNLTDIPLRFPEKRPFFLEGNELFQMLWIYSIADGLKTCSVVERSSGNTVSTISPSWEPSRDRKTRDREIEATELPLANYNYSVLRLQREVGKTSSVGFLGVNKQRGATYDRAGGLDARIQLPAATSLNLEYAREWKAGGLDMQRLLRTILSLSNSPVGQMYFHSMRSTQILGSIFTTETGFVPRVDRRGVVIRSRYNKQYKGTVERLRGEAEYERLANHAGELTTTGHVLVDSSALKTSFSSSGPNGIITSTKTTNPLPIEQRGSLWDGSHPNMCRSETPEVSVYAIIKIPSFSVRKLRSVRLLNSVLSLSYSDFTKSNQTEHSGNFRNGRDVLS